jgi:cbb3-type cytochrome oxidase subunit 3
MNPVLTAASASVQFGWVMGIMTGLFFVVFLGWALWAWHPANRERMRRAAAIPLDDDPEARA